MPDTPPPDLDTAIAQLQQRLGDTQIILNITVELRRNAQRLTAMLGDELMRVRDTISALLPLLPAVALLVLPA